MKKSDDRISRALNPQICKIAQKKYKKDIVCGQGCPMLDNCPIIKDEDRLTESIKDWTDLFMEEN